MSLLPQQILAPGTPLGTVNPDGTVTIAENWWLLFYNLWLNVLGDGSGIPADALIDLASADADAIDADAIALRQPLSNVLVQAFMDVMVSSADLPDIARALLLAQDGLLQDPLPRAAPAQSVTVGASPLTYTAAFTGTLVVAGGTVSAISIIRQGTAVTTGLTAGLIPLSRADQVQITYSAAPTITFLSSGN